jgi:hypothetical protein
MTKNLQKEYITMRKVEETFLEKNNLVFKREDFFNIPWNDPCV